MKSYLLLLLFLSTSTSIFGGIHMLMHPDGQSLNLSLSLLKSTPFENFYIPGLILSVIVGGSNLMALILTVKGNRFWFKWTIAAGVVLSLWIIIQIFLIKQIYWWHLFYVAIGFLIVGLTNRPKEKVSGS